MQTIGVRPAANAAATFRFTVVVGLAEQRAPLRVADDHVLGAGLPDHRRADLAGERALRSQYRSCAAIADVAVARRLGRGVNGRERRREDDLDAGRGPSPARGTP